MKAVDIEEFALTAIPPAGTLDVVGHVTHHPGRKIAGTDYPAGDGGHTEYRAAWFDGLVSTPVTDGPVFKHPREMSRFIDLLKGEGSELWERKAARRQRILDLEAAEAAAAASAKTDAATAKRLAAKGVNVQEATGGGSSRRSYSSAKRSGEERRAKREAWKTRQSA